MRSFRSRLVRLQKPGPGDRPVRVLTQIVRGEDADPTDEDLRAAAEAAEADGLRPHVVVIRLLNQPPAHATPA